MNPMPDKRQRFTELVGYATCWDLAARKADCAQATTKSDIPVYI